MPLIYSKSELLFALLFQAIWNGSVRLLRFIWKISLYAIVGLIGGIVGYTIIIGFLSLLA